MNTTGDADEFCREQQAAWDSAAPSWHRWWHVFENSCQGVNDQLVAAARGDDVRRWLDIACGIGEPARTAAAAIGAEGHVLACDLAPQMIEHAARFAPAPGAAPIEWRVADAETVELADQSFDAATCRWGLMLMRAPELAVQRVAAALRPGGRFAVAVWDAQAHVPFLARPRQAISRVVPLPELDADAPGPFRLHRPGQLQALLAAGDLEPGEEWTAEVALEFGSAGAFAAFVQQMSTATAKLLARHDPATRARAWAAVEADAAEQAAGDGRLRFDNRVRLCVGQRRG